MTTKETQRFPLTETDLWGNKITPPRMRNVLAFEYEVLRPDGLPRYKVNKPETFKMAFGFHCRKADPA
ncbi:hypothetical protein [Rhizobium sp.]|jgi:hypothetical protein|uniref:hypothetical protein n=1 Tax=Rhizobium sp. TaxID=391 RepID=UPI002AA62EB4